jgi:N-sulfoglucosamine sulfohydrolase
MRDPAGLPSAEGWQTLGSRGGRAMRIGLLAAMAMTIAIALGGDADAADRNVILIVGDDHGLDAGCYGHPDVKTPHLDRLAAQGVRFTNAFCTTASCSASRSVILSGLQNHTNGQYGHQHAEHNFHTLAKVRSLPALLKAGGYRTASLGKFHVQPESAYPFDETIPAGNTQNPVQMADRARTFLAKDDARPFFLYFCPTDPHRAGVGFGEDRPHPGVTEVTYDPATLPVPPFLPDLPETRAELAGYLQAVSRLDQGVGRLLAVLEETGHAGDTMVIYVSDNGMPWPGAKTTLYEPGMHLPLIVRAPGNARPGTTSDAMVSWIDLAPTILDHAGLAAEAGPGAPRLQGRSFLTAARGEALPDRDEVYASHTFHEVTMYYPMRAIRTRKYKLIRNLAAPLPFPFASDLWESRTWQAVLDRKLSHYGRRTVEATLHHAPVELYDLEADPDELRNLADDPAHAATRRALEAKLLAWQKATADPWVVKYQHE